MTKEGLVLKGAQSDVRGSFTVLTHPSAGVELLELESGPSPLIKHSVLILIGKMKQKTAQYGFRLSHGY